MKVITTVHKAGFNAYGHRWVESVQNWPTSAKFTMYGEGFDLPSGPTIAFKRNEDIARLEAFKAKHKDYDPLGWQWDVVRFANKVYAAYDAFYDHDGLGVWIDCDCVTYNRIPDGYIEAMLPEGAYMGLFKRPALYTETGFWLVDCTHEAHKDFFDAWLAWYESGAFQELTQWHDCTILDANVRLFEKRGIIQTVSLSQGFENYGHPMAKADLGRYIDHCKGNRKAEGRSMENEFRK